MQRKNALRTLICITSIFLTLKLFANSDLRTNYKIYSPNIKTYTVDSNHGHDASIVFFDGKWLAQWDDGTEESGQKIRQSTSQDLKTWSTPVEVYTSAVSTKNPVTEDMMWQPSLLVKGNELWSFVRASSNLYFSRLKSTNDKWENKLLFGWKDAQYRFPNFDGINWGIFAGNAGIILSSGRVVIPVTLGALERGIGFLEQKKRDSVIYSDDQGKTWIVSPGLSFGDGTQSWEATIWATEAQTIQMISRNNRKGPYNPRENIKTLTSKDGGETWESTGFIPALDAAMSRPFALRIGSRNILVQNDWYKFTQNHNDNRRNLSLFFSRGTRADEFVAGIPLTLSEDPRSIVDYPQMAINGNTGAVIYSSGTKPRITRVAEITPLPRDDQYYLFPRLAHAPLEVVKSGTSEIAVFKDNYNSVGVDIDSGSEQKILGVAFKVKIETQGKQTLLDLSNGVSLVSEKNQITLKKTRPPLKEVSCGKTSPNLWTQITFRSGKNITAARIGDGPYCTLDYAPFPRQLYLGHNSYSDNYNKTSKEKFLLDVSSIITTMREN